MNEFKSGFAPLIKEYLDFRKSMGFSNDHEKHLKRFDTYCAEHYPDDTILTKANVRGWYADEILNKRKCLQNKAAAIRLFAAYLGRNAYVLPANCIPKTPEFTPYILTEDELVNFYNAVDAFHYDKDPFLSETMKVLIRILYVCGLRPNEGRAIRMKDIDFVTGEILITKTKRNKERIVVASDDMLALLKQYRQKRELFAHDDECFFIHGDARPIESYQLRDYIKRCWKNANPEIDETDLPNLRPYDLRHRFASSVLQKWIDEGKNLYAMLPYLRAYMGHVRFEDTLYYIHILPERLVSSQGVRWDVIDSVGLEGGIWEH